MVKGNSRMDAVEGEHTATGAALAEAEAYAAAARAVAKLALNAAQGRPERLDALETALNAVLTSPGGAPDAIAAAVELVAQRRAQGQALSTNTLRLIAKSLRICDVDPDVALELRRAAAAPSGRPVPLSTAMSGVALLTRALSARMGRPLDVVVSVGDATAPESQLEFWRQAAISLIKAAASRADADVSRLEIRVETFHSAIAMSVAVPGTEDALPQTELADALIAALDGDEAAGQPLTVDHGELDVLASALNGSFASQTTADGRIRLRLLARREPTEGNDTPQCSSKTRAPRMAAARRYA